MKRWVIITVITAIASLGMIGVIVPIHWSNITIPSQVPIIIASVLSTLMITFGLLYQRHQWYKLQERVDSGEFSGPMGPAGPPGRPGPMGPTGPRGSGADKDILRPGFIEPTIRPRRS